MEQRASLFLSIALAGMAGLAGAAGPRWDITDESYLQLGLLGQVHASFTEDATDEHDLYLRRARLILSGQVVDGVRFFVETDNDNAGRNGVSSVSTDIQDAFVEQRLPFDHYLQGGLILLPFSFENAASAGSLLGLDYNLETLKFADTFAWRDYGVVLRGDVAKWVSYRLGAFDGYDDAATQKNPDAPIRATGHVAVHLRGDPESGWFFSQERLDNKPYLAVGFGLDHQPEATLITSTNGAPDTIIDNDAQVVDFQSGFPVGPLFATVNGGWYTWDNAVFEGDTAFLEGGLRHGDLQLTGKWSYQSPDAGGDLNDTTVGVHHYRHKHGARAGVEYRWGDSPSQVLVGFQISI